MDILQKLINWLEEASPEVWAILCRQVYVEAISLAAWGIVLVVSCPILVKLARWSQRKYTEEGLYSEYDILAFFAFISAPIAGVIGFALIVSSIMRFANPGFYAIKYIIGGVR